VHDLVVTGGRVIDPAHGIDGHFDVAVDGGRVAAVGAGLAGEATEVFDAAGGLVAPGFVDIHAHTYHANSGLIRDPDIQTGVHAGVTSFVDAGGVGPSHIDTFLTEVAGPAKTNVYNLLSMFSLFAEGDPRGAGRERDFLGRVLDPEGVVETARAHPDRVVGIKIHVMPAHNEVFGMRHLEAAREAADAAGIPILMHVGDIGSPDRPETDPGFTAAALALLRPGDVMTHLFTPLRGGALDRDGKVLPAVRAAQERGVYMDTAIGDYQFAWETAEAVLAQGITADTIASDLELYSDNVPAGEVLVVDGRTVGKRHASQFTLIEYMAFFLELGFDLPALVRMVTATPAQAMRIDDRAGTLRPGMPADLTIFREVEGRYRLTDVTGVSRTGTRALEPVAAVRAGEVILPKDPPHEWGFTPPPA
jgi:dihydroorotase